MAHEIFKKLLYSFIVAFVISMIFSLYKYQSIEGLEASQAGFLVILLNIGLNLTNFISSLFAFLNLNKKIRDFYILSFLSFCGPSLLILFLLLTIYLFSNNQNSSMSDFISISLPSVIYNGALLYCFMKFRENIDNTKVI